MMDRALHQQQVYYARRELGLCTKCGEPVEKPDKYAMCSRCRGKARIRQMEPDKTAYRKEYMRQYREEIKTAKRLTASERQTFMHMIAAVEAMENLKGLANRISSIPKGNWLYKTGKGIIAKLYDEIFKSIPYEQQKSIQRQLPGFRYSLAITNINGKDMRNDGQWLSWEALETMSEAIKDHCLMCTKNVEDQRKCRLAKALDELPCIKADEEARGCRYFGGLY